MMASPLPKTKAPAAAKKVNSAHRVPPAVAPTASRAARGSGEKLATPVFPFLQAFQNDLGGALTSQTRRPAASKEKERRSEEHTSETPVTPIARMPCSA